LFNRFELFAADANVEQFPTFLDFLQGGVPDPQATRQTARRFAKLTEDPSLLGGERVSTRFGGGGGGQAQQNAVFAAALAGVHPLFRQGVTRALEDLFQELGGSEAPLSETGFLPFLTEARNRGFLGLFP